MEPIRFLMIFRDKVKTMTAGDRKIAAGIMGEIITLLRDSTEESSGGDHGAD